MIVGTTFSQIFCIFASGFVVGLASTIAGIIYLKRWANRPGRKPI